MNHKTIFLLLNGEEPNVLPNFSTYDLICATDGASSFLEQNRIKADLITGDFDSSSEHSDDAEIIHTPDQNFTDFDKMLRILFDRGYTKIDVFGASGKEQDHFLGNLHTALKWKNDLKITFFDNHGTYFFCPNNFTQKNVLDKTVSLFPFPTCKGITTKGLQYPLKNEDLSFHERIGTRNKAIEDEISIQFKEGDLVLFIND